MKKIITKDGSITYYNENFSEHYHSISGAEEEALKKFILPSLKYLDKVNNQINILDVCFGLGYNSAAAIDELIKNNKNLKIKIIALENDINILNNILNLESNFKSYNKIKECIKNNYYYEDENLIIEIILGNGIEEIKKLNKKFKNKFDLVFHDPFSRTKMPEFWSEDFFKDEYVLLKKGGILTTYSCSKSIRENLKKVKFKIYDIDPVGRKAPSTLAIKLL